MNLFYYGNMKAEQDKTGLNAPLISIIVPVTQMVGRLGDLGSWLSLINFAKVEVVIVHDQQDAHTSRELSHLISEYSDVIRIEQTFNSAGLARNAGLEVARGRWIAFWDSDDIPSVETLNNFIEQEKRDDAEIYVFNFDVQRKDSLAQSVQSKDWQQLAINPGLWRLIFSRFTVQEVKFPSFPLGEDQYFLAQLGLPARKLQYVNQTLYTYKVGHQGQITSDNSKIKKLLVSLKALNRLRKDQNRNEFIFTSILFWRQLFTIIKRGQFSTRLIAISVGMRWLITPRIRTFWNLIALKKVLSYLANHHD